MKKTIILLAVIALITSSCAKKPIENITKTTEEHKHGFAATEQTVEHEAMGYCGNTETTIHQDGKSYTFMGGNSVSLTDMLLHLDYDPEKLCKCLPDISVDTEFGRNYGLSLGEDGGYARCDKGQADLTAEQVQKILEIIEKVKNGEVF